MIRTFAVALFLLTNTLVFAESKKKNVLKNQLWQELDFIEKESFVIKFHKKQELPKDQGVFYWDHELSPENGEAFDLDKIEKEYSKKSKQTRKEKHHSLKTRKARSRKIPN